MIPVEEKERIVALYREAPITLQAMSQRCNRCIPIISDVLNEYHCNRYSKAQLFNPNYNEHYFECIDNEYKAYYLGLIIADGCVFKNKTGRQSSLSITLKTEDNYILHEFKNQINVNTQVVEDKRGCSTIAVRSNLLCNHLARYGVVPRKTTIASLPQISDELYPHLLRGLFDGDGCVISHWCNNGKHKHCISFCGTPKLMSEIKELLISKLNVTARKQYNYTNTFGEVKWSRIDDLIKIGNYMYNNAHIYLVRKREIFEDFLQYTNTH